MISHSVNGGPFSTGCRDTPAVVRQANRAYAVASRLSPPHQGSLGTVCTTVPPVGVEPTLGTLLGGRPLPLGYGGWVIIPPLRGNNSWRTEFGGIVSPGGYISNSDPFHECKA